MWYTHTHAGRTSTHIKKLIHFKGFNVLIVPRMLGWTVSGSQGTLERTQGKWAPVASILTLHNHEVQSFVEII